MTSKEERALSFGAIAEDYDRLRPTPPPEALDWLVPDGCKVAVDVAAGTGLFTRALAQWVDIVIAVEPDPQMRAVLADRSPEIDVRNGTGESIPVPDASADALYVASAWHWLDESRALPEIARVLRDGGRLGVLWSSRDRELEWVRELDLAPGEERPADAVEDQHRTRREVTNDGDRWFTGIERRSFPFTRRMTQSDAVDMVATYSRVITTTAEKRAAILDRARELLTDQYGDAEEIDFPMRTWCWRGDRVPR
ncbi:MAG TPA: class I SAM-dependent methyltransferase [Mycobacteriales bacterium]|nr:class I SAM-dependent methyltransferase [Mycobacteriales bacterium]